MEVTLSASTKAFYALPLLMAQELGAFDEENLDVSIEILPVPDASLLLDEGGIDGVVGAVSAGRLNLAASGSSVRAVFPIEPEYEDETAGGVWVRREVLGDDGYQPSDLEGVDIAWGTGGISSAGLAWMWNDQMRPAGIDAEDVGAQSLGVSDTALALQQGSLDAGLVLPPFTEAVRDSDCCEFIGGDPPDPYAWLWFGERLLEDREVGRAVVRAIARTTEEYLSGDYLADPEKVEAIARVLEQPADAVEREPLSVWDLASTEVEGLLDPLFEFWLARGDVVSFTEPLEVDQVFDMSFFEEVVGT